MSARQAARTVSPSAAPIRVAVVEDDRRVRESLCEILRGSAECLLVGAFTSGEQALAGLDEVQPRVIVVDVNLPGMSGVDVIRRIADLRRPWQTLVLTVYRDTDTIFEALSAGAVGYLVKPITPTRLVEAVCDVAAGGAPMTGAVARKVVQAFARSSRAAPAAAAALTSREREVLDMLVQGLTKKEIAARMGVAFATVRTHLEHVYKKLHVRSQAEAVARWLGDRPHQG
ncbi:MAG: response regulator transcription factor [Planctomycetaceae bacterium]